MRKCPHRQRIADQLRDLARDVWRIGDGYRDDPESIAVQKDTISKQLHSLAKDLECDT
jgi:hypothetical protein